jgi:Zn-dependent protease
MTQVLALVGAIALIVLVLTLRNLLAIPYRRESARFVTAMPPKGTESLFDEAQQQLRALGFDDGRWIITTAADGSPSYLPLRVVHAHADGTMVAVGSPTSAAHPHRLHTYFASRLQDGRTAISQAFDPYFEVTQTDEMIARTSGETSLSAQYLEHQSWLSGLGSAATAADDSTMLDLIGGMMERQRQALIKAGALRALSPDLAVPRLGFAWRIFKAVRNMPKTPADPRPVPAERLALLARNQELTQQRAPSRPVQWSLFGISVALFMALGALLWGMQFAFFILVVVLIHELGHFLAMRAFGYRNVHLMALPLVGGVAIGVDANPAATRRAWMSLMGPLPGILIGWALAVLWMLGVVAEPYSAWLGTLALMFLLINYLNVLPVPPLDGAHVVASLLPPRWARVEAVFLAVAAILGGLLAWHFDFVLITVLAALQLFQVPVLWRQHSVERDLAVELAPGKGHRSQRLLRVLRELERRLGPTSAAGERIKMALSILLRLDTRPMSGVAWLSTTAVYLSLLLVPVAGLLVFGLGMAIQGVTPESDAAHYQQLWDERVQLQRDAKALSLQQLIAELEYAGDPAAAAASAEAIAAAEQRLGRALPAELRALYLARNGVPSLGLLPIEDLQPARAIIERDLAPYTTNLSFEIGGED